MTASRKKMKVSSVKEMHRALNSISKYSGNDDGAPKIGRPHGSRNVPFKDEQISSTSTRWTSGSDELRPTSIAVDGYDYVYSYPLRETTTKKRKRKISTGSKSKSHISEEFRLTCLFTLPAGTNKEPPTKAKYKGKFGMVSWRSIMIVL